MILAELINLIKDDVNVIIKLVEEDPKKKKSKTVVVIEKTSSANAKQLNEELKNKTVTLVDTSFIKRAIIITIK
jgi:fatty acid-binding protein DegV